LSSTHSTAQALAFGLAGVALFSGLDAVTKHLSASEHTLMVTFGRYLCALPFALLIWRRAGSPGITGEMWRAHGLRGTVMAVAASLFYFGLSTVPLAEAITLSFIGPLLVPFLAAAMLGERLRFANVAASVVGFAGAAIAVMGGEAAAVASSFDPALYRLGVFALIGFSAAYALSAVLLRARAGRDGSAIVGVLATLVPCVVVAGPALAFAEVPSAASLPFFLLAGALGAVSMWTLTEAYVRAEAQVLAPLEFTALLWGALLGYVFFNEIPRLELWLGAAIIVAACLWSGWKSTQPAATGVV
jgi:drug/metabolite transporter (DMT)-like permease